MLLEIDHISWCRDLFQCRTAGDVVQSHERSVLLGVEGKLIFLKVECCLVACRERD